MTLLITVDKRHVSNFSFINVISNVIISNATCIKCYKYCHYMQSLYKSCHCKYCCSVVSMVGILLKGCLMML